MTKQAVLIQAIEITKEYCRGGSELQAPASVLRDLYNQLLELSTHATSN